MVIGSNPPATCKTEVYEPPFDNPKRPGVEAFTTLGLGIDTNGLVWAALAGSNDLASFDRRKCKEPLFVPTATGQQCPEGWTLYSVPGPKFKGTNITGGLSSTITGWTATAHLGLGKNVPIINGTGSDLLIALSRRRRSLSPCEFRIPWIFIPETWMAASTIQMLDGRGAGIWSGNEERVIWHLEGGKGGEDLHCTFPDAPGPACKVGVRLRLVSEHSETFVKGIQEDGCFCIYRVRAAAPVSTPCACNSSRFWTGRLGRRMDCEAT